jgi:hypothetical protein
VQRRPELSQFVAREDAIATAFLSRFLSPPRRIRFDPILVDGKRKQRGDALQHTVALNRSCLSLRLHEFAHVPTTDIRDASMPPNRQDLLLQDAADFGPAAQDLLLPAAIQLVKCLHRLVVLRVLRLLLGCGISAIKDAAAVLRGSFPRLFQEDVRVAPESDAPHPAVVAVVQRERLAAGGRDADCQSRHKGIEHLVPFPVRLQLIKIASGQRDGGHGFQPSRDSRAGDRSGVTPG